MRQNHLKTRIAGRDLKILASARFRGLPSSSVGFRLHPRPLGRGDYVSFGYLPAIWYWRIWGEVWGFGALGIEMHHERLKARIPGGKIVFLASV